MTDGIEGNSMAARVAKLNSLLKVGEVGSECERVAELVKTLLPTASNESLELLRGQNLLSEFSSLNGKHDDASMFAERGRDYLEEIRLYDRVDRQSAALIREKIRTCLNYALTWFYRRGDYRNAKGIIEDCLNVILRVRQPVTYPLWGTLAQTYYYRGRVHRQMYDYDQAEEDFVRSIDCYLQRALFFKRDRKRTPSKLSEDLLFTSHKSALCFSLGLASIDYDRGYITKALYNVMSARLLFLAHKDPVNTALAEMIYGGVQRARAGREQNGLNEALRTLETAIRAFGELPHYAARGKYEVSKILYYLGDYWKALNVLPLSSFASNPIEESRWKTDAAILRSRIEQARGGLLRNQPRANAYKSALNSANEACGFADQQKDQHLLAESLICRGQALLVLQKTSEAQAAFKQALEIAERSSYRNPLTKAVCCLHLTRSYIHDGNEVLAAQHWTAWERQAPEIEHGFVHSFAQEISEEMKALDQPLVIDTSAEDLNFEKKVKQLREFLLRKAAKHYRNKQDQAEALGISRDTYYQWLRKRKKGISKR